MINKVQFKEAISECLLADGFFGENVKAIAGFDFSWSFSWY